MWSRAAPTPRTLGIRVTAILLVRALFSHALSQRRVCFFPPSERLRKTEDFPKITIDIVYGTRILEISALVGKKY